MAQATRERDNFHTIYAGIDYLRKLFVEKLYVAVSQEEKQVG